jgi:diguanylate cyclase (GGDEF)-like protein
MRGATSFGRQFVLPNGIILMIAFGLQRLAILVPTQQNAEMAVFVTGAAALALAWRFHLPRMALALVTVVVLMLGSIAASTAQASIASCALAIIAFAAPINIAFLLLIDDANFDLESLGWWAGVISIEALLIYAMSRSEASEVAHWLRSPVLNLGFASFLLTPIAVVTLLALAALLANYAFSRKAPDAALFWTTLALSFALAPRASESEALFFVAASFIVGAGILEGSYSVAYHDELTGLPGRRAYNRLATHLSGDYAIAVVDIDHFKKFNDTYGHDIGDQVLRMVANKLAAVTGYGKAFRMGGEEFAIVFPHGSAENAIDHLEILREEIELSPFIVRGPDRSRRERPERRQLHEPRKVRGEAIDTHVTVSIGVADSQSADDHEAMMQCADRALYQAKSDGRNRVTLYTGYQAPEKKRKRSPRRKSENAAEISADRFR